MKNWGTYQEKIALLFSENSLTMHFSGRDENGKRTRIRHKEDECESNTLDDFRCDWIDHPKEKHPDVARCDKGITIKGKFFPMGTHMKELYYHTKD